jgi:hypothetical protein
MDKGRFVKVDRSVSDLKFDVCSVGHLIALAGYPTWSETDEFCTVIVTYSYTANYDAGYSIR